MAWQTCATWDGTPDGNWSIFRLRVGSPPQDFCALVSTSIRHLELPFEYRPDCSQISRSSANYVAALDSVSRFMPGGSRVFDPSASSSFKDELFCLMFSDMLDDGYPSIHGDILNESVRGMMYPTYPKTGYRSPGETVESPARIGLLSGFIGKPPWISFNDVPTHSKRSLMQLFPAMQNTMSETAMRLELMYSYTAGAWYSTWMRSCLRSGELKRLRTIPWGVIVGLLRSKTTQWSDTIDTIHSARRSSSRGPHDAPGTPVV